MAHEANEIVDGLYKLSQNVENNRVTLYYMGEQVRTIQPGRLLSFQELHEMLLSERSNLEIGGIEE
jgi:hypothetical protein